MDIEIRKLATEEVDLFVRLIYLFEEVFEASTGKVPPPDHLQRVLKLDSFFVFVALLKNEVVGGLTAYMLPQYHSVTPLVYLYDLAVSAQHQRQGIGKQLLTSLKDYCRQRGVREVFVQADEDDAQATDFYRSTGGMPANVIHFTYPLAD